MYCLEGTYQVPLLYGFKFTLLLYVISLPSSLPLSIPF